jgi:hypothetical protein
MSKHAALTQQIAFKAKDAQLLQFAERAGKSAGEGSAGDGNVGESRELGKVVWNSAHLREREREEMVS